MLSLPLASADIISRRSVNIDQARQCEFKLLETLIWVETEGEGCKGPDHLPGKNTSCHLFPRRKTGKNLFEKQFDPPPPPPPPPPALSGSDGGIISFTYQVSRAN